MSRVIIATGKLAKKPYHIAKIERNIYSIEELCYSLVQSAQFLDTDIMDPELVAWIGTDLGLPELSKKLNTYLGKERALSDFVSTILDFAGYVSQDKQIRTRQIVSSGVGMEPFEKRAKRAGYMAENGQSYQALNEYESILDDLPEPERQMRADVCRRIGRIYTDLFRFRAAADAFKKAYDISGSSSVYLEYLAAIRFGLSDAEYVAFISEHPESYNASLELEKRVREANVRYAESDDKVSVDQLMRYRDLGQETNYEIALHQTIQDMKDGYRRAKQPAF